MYKTTSVRVPADNQIRYLGQISLFFKEALYIRVLLILLLFLQPGGIFHSLFIFYYVLFEHEEV